MLITFRNKCMLYVILNKVRRCFLWIPEKKIGL